MLSLSRPPGGRRKVEPKLPPAVEFRGITVEIERENTLALLVTALVKGIFPKVVADGLLDLLGRVVRLPDILIDLIIGLSHRLDRTLPLRNQRRKIGEIWDLAWSISKDRDYDLLPKGEFSVQLRALSALLRPWGKNWWRREWKPRAQYPLSNASFEIPQQAGITLILGHQLEQVSCCFRLIAGAMRAKSGEIRLFGEPVATHPALIFVDGNLALGFSAEEHTLFRARTRSINSSLEISRLGVQLTKRLLKGIDDSIPPDWLAEKLWKGPLFLVASDELQRKRIQTVLALVSGIVLAEASHQDVDLSSGIPLRVVVLDIDLDTLTDAQRGGVYDLLNELKFKRNLQFILSSSEPGKIWDDCNFAVVLGKGQVVYQGEREFVESRLKTRGSLQIDAELEVAGYIKQDAARRIARSVALSFLFAEALRTVERSGGLKVVAPEKRDTSHGAQLSIFGEPPKADTPAKPSNPLSLKRALRESIREFNRRYNSPWIALLKYFFGAIFIWSLTRNMLTGGSDLATKQALFFGAVLWVPYLAISRSLAYSGSDQLSAQYLSDPHHPLEGIIARATAATVKGVLAAVGTGLLIVLAEQIPVSAEMLSKTALVLIAALPAYVGYGLVLSTLVQANRRDGGGIITALSSLVLASSGSFFSIRNMPEPFIWFSACFPVIYSMNGVRIAAGKSIEGSGSALMRKLFGLQLPMDNSLTSMSFELLALLLKGIVFSLLAVKAHEALKEIKQKLWW